MPIITVGMPVYNRAHVLADTINQVLSQTFKDFELLIYNDGSVDNSSEIIRSFKDQRIVFFDKENLGPPHPLNFILNRAQGEYVIFLHDHDFFHPELLEKSYRALEKYKEAGFVLQGSAWIDEDGDSNYREMLHALPELNAGRTLGETILSNLSSFSSIFHACCMVRKSAYRKIGNYNPDFGFYSDTDVWLRLLREFPFVYIREVLFKFRTREAKHVLSDKEFKILNWNYNIHKTNIAAYWPVEEDRNKKLRILEKKRISNIQRLTLYYAANNKANLFLLGLEILSREEDLPKYQKHLGNILYKSRNTRLVFSKLIGFLNHIRKNLRN